MDFDFEDEPSRLQRLLPLVLAVVTIGVAVTAGWYLLIRDEAPETVLRSHQEVQVKRGQLVSSFQTTGSAAAGLSADLSFGLSGTVESVSVAAGDVVTKEQGIARLKSDDALAALASAEANLEIAQLQLEDLFAGADAGDKASAAESVANALISVADAEGQLETAQDALDDALLDPPTAEEIEDLQDAVERAERTLEAASLGLTAAEEHQAQLDADPDPLELAQREEDVRQAERQLEEAREDLAKTILLAPFDGTIAALEVEPGNTVDAATIIATVVDTEQMTIDLTVSESDLPGLEVGQFGLAEFSALPDELYVVEIVSVTALPSVAQGVVTYPVLARVLGPDDLNNLEGGPEQIAPVLFALGKDSGSVLKADGLGGSAIGGTAKDKEAEATGDGSDKDPDGKDDGLAGLKQIADFITKDADGTLRLKEGAEIPDDLELPAGLVINDDGTIELPDGPSSPADLGERAGDGAIVEGLLSALLDAPLPSPGMSATVTILKEIQTSVLLVPNSAISLLSGAASVRVLNADGIDEQRSITIGDSDATSTVVLSDLAEGETILVIGAAGAPPVQEEKPVDRDLDKGDGAK